MPSGFTSTSLPSERNEDPLKVLKQAVGPIPASTGNGGRLMYPDNLETLAYYMRFDAQRVHHLERTSTKKQTPLVSVYLPLPAQLGVGYSRGWENQTIGVIGSAAATVADAGANWRDTVGSIEGIIDSIQKGSSQSAIGMLNSALRKGGFAGANFIASGESGSGIQMLPWIGDVIRGAKLGLRVNPNPHRALLFNNLDFRSHRFDFQFAPKNLAESTAVKAIIKAFKYYSAPGWTGEKQFFTYPDEFQISFHYPEYLFAFMPAVLTSMSVNYHAAGQAAYFQDTKAPVAVSLSLEFTETSIITKRDFDDVAY
jgi:hypothetical protein